MIAVWVQQRAFADVVTDMIEGVLAANRLEGEAAARVAAMLRAYQTSQLPESVPNLDEINEFLIETRLENEGRGPGVVGQ